MNDEQRSCGNCGHEHAYGTLRHSWDGVPIKGARRCWCNCTNFVERNEIAERLFGKPLISGNQNLVPALSDKKLKELWADTSFLNAQVPLATRLAIRQIRDLFTREALPGGLTDALMEFTGLVISQLTDIRGAMTRDDSKFAHLVAHTDEIVDAMRSVTQLAERLNNIYGAINQIQQQQAKTERDIAGIAAVLKTLAPDAVEIKQGDRNPLREPQDEEDRRVFIEKIAAPTGEPILTDSDPVDD
jgi:hypothetical protein